MPIDLKWVRTDPDRVREWQNLRRRVFDAGSESGNGDADDAAVATDLVGDVLEKDELSRKHLRALQEHKRSLKEIQVGLRPNQKNTDDRGNTDAPTDPKSGRAEGGATKPEFLPPPANDRETLLRKKKAAERKIGLAEADWRASLREMREALSGLASPVAPAKPDPNGGGDSEGTTLRTALPPVCFGGKKTVLGGDLERAWTEHTLRRFAAYPWVELPGGVPVAAEPPAPLSQTCPRRQRPDQRDLCM